MRGRYPEIEPYEHGFLDVGDGHRLYWEACGNPDGKPALVVHGGPGTGCGPGLRRYFDPARYRVILFDQRGCGRSTPSAAEPDADLSTNTTDHLVADIERLREHVGIDRWLVFGGSWGSTLGIVYAERHPERVTEVVMVSIVSTSRREVDWVTRQMGRIFPAEWARLRDAVPPADRDGDLSAAYAKLLRSPDPAVHQPAADAWCEWEDTHVATAGDVEPYFTLEPPEFRLTVARLVTHYWSNAAWLPEGAMLADAHRLAGIPGTLVHGRLDISGPPDIAWHLARAWPDATLVLIGGAGHGTGDDQTVDALVTALDDYAVSKLG